MIQIEITILIISFIGAYLGATIANWVWHRRYWKISFDEKKKEFTLESEEEPKGRVSFMSEAGPEELEELSKPAWRKLWEAVRIKKEDRDINSDV